MVIHDLINSRCTLFPQQQKSVRHFLPSSGYCHCLNIKHKNQNTSNQSDIDNGMRALERFISTVGAKLMLYCVVLRASVDKIK